MKNDRLIKNLIVAVLIIVTLWFGLRPLFLGTSHKNYTKVRPGDFSFEENEYATIIIGSEPEGIASALACSRIGLKTLLITNENNLGSSITKSMIPVMDLQQGVINQKKVLLNQGIYQEIFGKFDLGFNVEDYEKSITKLTEQEESLKIIYGSTITQVDLEGDVLKGIVVQNQDGEQYYKARNFIDATQDGELLVLCKTPYFKGSEDLGLPNFYSPLKFNFRITGVDMEVLKKNRKITDFFDEFQIALLAYEKVNPNSKIISPSFISQNDEDLVITGLQIYGVDVEDKEALTAAYKAAEEEARMLTAFLKNVMVAFKDSQYKESPEAFFIPEYRHFEGRYRLRVSDILENKDFNNKIALCAAAVDAGKYVDKSIEYIVAKPHVYAIPLESIIPSNLKNVMMIGAKASFTSLAATSAGNMPTQITLGESAGLVAAYSFVNNTSPADMLKLPDEQRKAWKAYLKRGGVSLTDFSENLLIPGTEQKLTDHWAYPNMKILAEFGLIAGGKENDFKLDFKASQEVLTVLVKNAIIKMAPNFYNLELDKALKVYEVKKELSGELASAIVLDALSIPFEKGEALKTLKGKGILPVSLTDRLTADGPVTMDVVYGLAVETVKAIKS